MMVYVFWSFFTHIATYSAVLYTPPHVPADSDRLRQIPVDSSGLQSLSPISHILSHPGFCGLWWTLLLDSGGLYCWTPVDSAVIEFQANLPTVFLVMYERVGIDC